LMCNSVLFAFIKFSIVLGEENALSLFL